MTDQGQRTNKMAVAIKTHLISYKLSALDNTSNSFELHENPSAQKMCHLSIAATLFGPVTSPNSSPDFDL